MKIMQNVVILVNPRKEAYDISTKAVNMYMNRFCIEEDAAFEISGVNYLEDKNEGKEF